MNIFEQLSSTKLDKAELTTTIEVLKTTLNNSKVFITEQINIASTGISNSNNKANFMAIVGESELNAKNKTLHEANLEHYQGLLSKYNEDAPKVKSMIKKLKLILELFNDA
jgi:hypothetical protein